MVGHGGSSASWYLADPTSPIPSHCASIVTTSTLRVNDPYTALPPGRKLIMCIDYQGSLITNEQAEITGKKGHIWCKVIKFMSQFLLLVLAHF